MLSFFSALKRISVKRKLSWFVLKIPFINDLIKQVYVTRFAMTMSLLLASRVNLVKALELSAGMINFIPIKDGVEMSIQQLIKGASFAESLIGISVFDNKLRTHIKIAESVNKLPETFASLADEYQKELDHKTSLFNSFLEPVLILLVASVVGIVLVSMYLPLFKMGTTVG